MVLEEATSQEAPFADATPTSDIDQYASDNAPPANASSITVARPGTTPLYVDLSSIQQSWNPLIARPTTNILTDALQAFSKHISENLGRPAKQDEVDAAAYHMAKTQYLASLGSPVGGALGGLQAFRKRANFRFPGWTPGERFQPERFGPIRGQLARYYWHGLRFAGYVSLGAVLGNVFFASYAVTVGTVGRMSDPRLKEINQAQVRAIEASREKATDRTAAPRQGETFEMARQRRGVQDMQMPRQRQTRGAESAQGDDMSPTGGSFGQEFTDTGAETGMLSDAQIQQYDRQPRPEARMSATDNAAAGSGTTGGSNNRRRQTDDASPTSSPDGSPKQPGSSWERLRQQAASGQKPPSRSEASTMLSMPSRARDSPPSSDSFSFSQGDEDRQLAKSEAQKDFDARLERERQGQNFEDKADGRRKW